MIVGLQGLCVAARLAQRVTQVACRLVHVRVVAQGVLVLVDRPAVVPLDLPLELPAFLVRRVGQLLFQLPRLLAVVDALVVVLAGLLLGRDLRLLRYGRGRAPCGTDGAGRNDGGECENDHAHEIPGHRILPKYRPERGNVDVVQFVPPASDGPRSGRF